MIYYHFFILLKCSISKNYLVTTKKSICHQKYGLYTYPSYKTAENNKQKIIKSFMVGFGLHISDFKNLTYAK